MGNFCETSRADGGIGSASVWEPGGIARNSGVVDCHTQEICFTAVANHRRERVVLLVRWVTLAPRFG